MAANKWDKAYMDCAHRFAELSTAERLKVGAVIVKDHRIISIGYNGMPSGWDNCCEEEHTSLCPGYDPIVTTKTKPEVMHAEENAIAKLARSNESGDGASIYLTHSPCINCAKLIYASGIKKVFYRTQFRDDAGIIFLKKCGIIVENS